MTAQAQVSPFLPLADSRGGDAGWALLGAPICTRAHHRELAALTCAGVRLAGMSSYLTFPRDIPDERDYGLVCEAWCHPFREPERFLPAGMPAALLSLSDFTDPRLVRPLQRWPARARWDVVYVGASESWKREAKGWWLAARCLPRICDELGLRALVVGAPGDGFEPSPRVRFTPWLPWPEFLATLAAARVLFVPNGLDPSPRVIAEALCLDVPVVVNRAILGGWKYVNAFTGEHFDGEHDATAAVERCLARGLRPRRWFAANHGPYHAGRRLLGLLRSVDPALRERSHLVIA
jgi:glycosyltransferase involved in cell wall biosynthesis